MYVYVCVLFLYIVGKYKNLPRSSCVSVRTLFLKNGFFKLKEPLRLTEYLSGSHQNFCNTNFIELYLGTKKKLIMKIEYFNHNKNDYFDNMSKCIIINLSAYKALHEMLAKKPVRVKPKSRGRGIFF